MNLNHKKGVPKMDTQELLNLAEELRDEVEKRELDEFTFLFGKNAREKCRDMVSALRYLPPNMRPGLRIAPLLILLCQGAGCIQRQTLREDIASLWRIYKIFERINDAANQGVFGSHEVTIETNKVKGWLRRDIELMQNFLQNSRP